MIQSRLGWCSALLLTCCGAAALLSACGGAESPADQADPAAAADPADLSSTSCAVVMPAAIPPGWSFEEAVSDVGSCLAGTSDGNGVIAIGSGYGPGFSQDFESVSWSQFTSSGVPTSAAVLTVTGTESLFGQPSGFQVAWQQDCESGAPCSNAKTLSTWHAGSGTRHDGAIFSTVQADDPKGGMVLAGVDGGGKFLVQRFNQSGAALSAPALVVSGPVTLFGSGASRSGPTLAVWDVGAAGGAAGTVRGRWLSSTGRALTGTFVVATGVADGFGFDLVPLLDGTLAVRTSISIYAGVPARFLGRFAPGSTVRTAVPGWLATRPTASVFPIRGAHAYALLFPVDNSSGCGVQHIALFSGSGTRCGGFDADLGGSYTCVNKANIGRDGTLFLSGGGDPGYGSNSCKQRVIPALLR